MSKENEFDFSDFDNEVGQEESLDFSDFDKELEEQETSNELEATARSGAVGGGILAGQKAIKKSGLANKVSELPGKFVDLIGELDDREFQKISNNSDIYKNAGDLNDLVVDAEDIERSLQKNITDRIDSADKSIINNNITLPKEELAERLDSVKTIQQYTPSQEGINKRKELSSKVDELDSQIKPLENELGEVTSSSNLAKQEVKELTNSIDGRVNEIDRSIKDTSDPKIKKELSNQKKDLLLQKREVLQKSKATDLQVSKQKKATAKQLKELKVKHSKLKQDMDKLPTDGKVNSKEIEKYVKDQKDFLKNIESPKGEEAVSILKKARADADYNKALGTESFSNKAAKKYSKGIRSTLGEASPEYDKLMKESSEVITDRKEFAKLLGLKGDLKRAEPLVATNTTVKRLESLAKDVNSPDNKRLRQLLTKYNLEDFINKTDLAAIRSKVQKSTGIGNINIGDYVRAGLAGGLAETVLPGSGAALGTAVAGKHAIGTKIQEQLALISGALAKPADEMGLLAKLAKGSGKILKGAGKMAYKSLPLVGAAASYQEAQAAEMSPLETAAYIGAEELNPLPVSLLDMKEGMEEEAAYGSNQMRGKADKLQDFLEKERQDPEAEKLKQRMNQYNKAKDRELMSLEGDKPAKIDKLKDLETMQSTINKLKTMNTDSSNNYAQDLQSVEGEDDQRKDAVLMGLMQQPAFREMLRRTEKENDDGDEIN